MLVHYRNVNVTTIPAARRNGTMYAHVFILPAEENSARPPDWINSQSVPLTKYEVPQAGTFQLISDSAESKVRPVSTEYIVTGVLLNCQILWLFLCRLIIFLCVSLVL